MTDLNGQPSSPPPPETTEPSSSLPSQPPNDVPKRRFDPSRTIGIIKRKALIKDLAAVYHAECLAYCQELLQLQRKCEEPYADMKVVADLRKEAMRPPKRLKKSR
ncbi:hypothetical protein Tco_0866264 [Tanacetum coccineum]